MQKRDLSRLTLIMRGLDYDRIAPVLDSMQASNFNCIEITSNSPDAEKTIRKIKKLYKDIYVGAGTVFNLDQVKKFQDSGAEFILSPISLEEKVIEYCNDNKILCIPSAMTPSEIYKMFNLGADVVKVFPATTVGAKFFKDIQAPLGDLDLMAVGGVNINNAKSFIGNKCRYLGVGSGLFKKTDIDSGNTNALTNTLIDFRKILGD